MPMPDPIVEMAKALSRISRRVVHLETVERSEIAGGVAVYTFAALPAKGDGTVGFCSNCRKVGEGVGAGTGTLVYRQGGTYYRVGDDTAAAT